MSELCPTCNQIKPKPKSFWLKHVEKELTDAWLKETINVLKQNAKIDFEIYKNSKGEFYFIELQGNEWREMHGRYATIVNVNNLRKLNLAYVTDALNYLMGCSFGFFYNKEQFENEYKKLF